MLLFSLAFLIGISQLIWLPMLKVEWLYFWLVFILVAFFNRHKTPVIIIVLFGICLGFSHAIIQGHYAKSHQLQWIPEDIIEVTGIVSSLPIKTHVNKRGDKIKFELSLDQSAINLKKILVTWYQGKEDIKMGQKWVFKLKLKPIHGLRNPGSFDYRKWLFRYGYDATATVKSAKLSSSQPALNFFTWIGQQRSKIAQLINDKFVSDRVKGLVRALSIGDRSQISSVDSQLFQDTGTAHIIAISGLHIGLMAFIGVLIGRLVFYVLAFEKVNRYKYEALFAIGFALFYALLAGLSIPTIRAFVMVMVFSLAYAMKFKVSRWQAWATALLIVLIIDPFSVLDVGFWFSFSAVAVLMFVFTGRTKNHYKFIGFIKAQLFILIGLMPLMILVFHKVNLLTPIANLLVLPIASMLLIPLMFSAFLVNMVSENISQVLFQFVEIITLFFFSVLDYLQRFNFLSFSVNNINALNIFLLVIAVVMLLLPKLFRWKWLGLVLFVPFFVGSNRNLNDGQYLVNVLDVGQGLSVIVRTKNHTLIYDTGAKYESGFSMAQAVVIPYLQNQGQEDVDTLFISHDDNDHAGGIVELRNTFKEMDVYGVKGVFNVCQYPKAWNWDGVQFEVLSPFEIMPYLGNNSSCVLKLSSKNGSMLLTGDIEEPVEYRLVKNLPDYIKSDVMLVPHHGSRTSSSLSFVKHVKPSIVVNSSGFANQFNHPHPSIKSLYLSMNIAFFDTQNSGMIEIQFNETGIVIKKQVDEFRHIWDLNE